MKLKFNLGKPGQKHIYFSVEQEKREPFIYLVNGRMLSCIQQSELNDLINQGHYFAVVEYLESICDENLDHGRVFSMCDTVLKNFIMESV